MLKISKITDYGIVLLTHVARNQGRENWSAKDLAAATGVPLPTVGKVLKMLSRGEILASSRGSQGGYKLTKNPEQISLGQVLKILEGHVSLTECGEKGPHACGLVTSCINKSNWQKINGAIYQTLESLSLADMSRPLQIRGLNVIQR